MTAKAVLEKKRFLYVGFLCHQTVEKCLKAYFWLTQKHEPPLTHNLILLSKQSGFDARSEEKYIELFKELMPLNIQTRYPEDKELLLKSLTAARCRKLLNETTELYAWIKKLSK